MESDLNQMRLQSECTLIVASYRQNFLLANHVYHTDLLPSFSAPLLPISAFLSSHSRSSSVQSGAGGLEADSRSSSRGSLEELPQLRHRDASSALSASMRQKMLLDYSVYMAKYVNSQVTSSSPTAAAAAESPGHSPASSPRTAKKVGRGRFLAK